MINNPDTAKRIEPLLSEEDALRKVGLRKRFRFFGGVTEKVVECELTYRPLIKTVIIVVSGKKIVKKTLVFDGYRGVPVLYKKGLRFRIEYSRFMHLKQDEIRVLFHLIGRGSGTMNDVIRMIRFPDSSIKKAVKSLHDKKLITRIGKMNNAHVYKPVINARWIKNIKELSTRLPEGIPAKKERTKFNPSNVREFVKGIDTNAEVANMTIVYYPFYKIRVKGEEKRTVFIDGLNGSKTVF